MIDSHQWAQNRSLVRIVLLALALTALMSLLLLFDSRNASAQTSPKADYRFQNTRSTSAGTAPALTDIGPGTNTFTTAAVDGTSRRVLSFPKANGLKLSPTTNVVNSGTYTIVVLFELNRVDGFRRIVDFKNGTNDNGLYVRDGKLAFFRTTPESGTSARIAANTYVQVVLTRDNNGVVVGYVDGAQQFSFLDSSTPPDAGIDSNNTLRFFKDNERSGSTIEHSAGSVARIRLYNSALTPTEVGALDRIEPTTFTVNSTLDGADPNTLDGKCDMSTTAGIQCTLRAAIQQANATSGTDTINFTSAVSNSGTIPLSQGQLSIANDASVGPDLTINGPGAGVLTVSGNNSSRVFEIASGANATINGVKISNGKLTGSPFGAGLYNEGTLTLNNSVVSANTADSAGGGIFNRRGTLALNNSAVNGNESIFTLGGGILNSGGTVTLKNTVVSGNDANVGGGIRNTTDTTTTPISHATLSLTNSTVTGNTSNNNGGGIDNSGGTVTMTRSTLSGNIADGDGGGIGSSGTLTLENSTVSGNSAGDKGGGIANFGTLGMTNSTVTNNTGRGDDPDSAGGGIFNSISGTATLRNTIVAKNTAPAAADIAEASPNSFTSGGNNLIGDTGGTSGFGTSTSDLLGQDPLLGPLTNNSGPTKTHALLQGSLAIDRGTNTGCDITDQRGVTRKDGDANGTVTCDIGAFEAANTKPTITNLKPAPGSDTRDRTPLISATVRDAQTNLAKTDIKLFVDGNRKSTFDYNRSTDRLTFTSGRLSLKGHTVKIIAIEGLNTTTRSWTFKVV